MHFALKFYHDYVGKDKSKIKRNQIKSKSHNTIIIISYIVTL